jgi:hypothetical protein
MELLRNIHEEHEDSGTDLVARIWMRDLRKEWLKPLPDRTTGSATVLYINVKQTAKRNLRCGSGKLVREWAIRYGDNTRVTRHNCTNVKTRKQMPHWSETIIATKQICIVQALLLCATFTL